jgi:hypothetical protein
MLLACCWPPSLPACTHRAQLAMDDEIKGLSVKQGSGLERTTRINTASGYDSKPTSQQLQQQAAASVQKHMHITKHDAGNLTNFAADFNRNGWKLRGRVAVSLL